MAKKKMTPAQAASARREETARSAAKRKARENQERIKEEQRKAKEEKQKSSAFRLAWPIVAVVLIIAFCVAFTVLPGMMMGK